MIELGCDRLLTEAAKLHGRAYGLLAHGASLTADCRPLHLALASSPAGAPTVFFGPEHGYYGVEQDMVPSEDQEDPWTGSAIRSLYGDSKQSLRPRPSAFDGLELLVIDLQDVGSRYYTYAATAVWAAEVALQAGLEVWLLDRPNPLGGEVVEGGPVEEGYESFVGALALPVRHGLSLGEILQLEAARRAWPAGLRVWPVGGWKRSMRWAECGRPWVAPSPNMPTVDTAVVYPGGCLVEATELSEGRGSTRPFQLVGHPDLDGRMLAHAMNERGLPGVTFLPTFFKPQFQKHGGSICGGVELIVTDVAGFQPYRTGVELLACVARLAPDCFTWRKAPYEFEHERPAIDLLTGSKDLRRALAAGASAESDLQTWISSWSSYEADFQKERRAALLYSEVSP